MTSQPETQPASMQLEDKENTPPEGRSTPTLDERASSSQESLPCAVGFEFYIQMVTRSHTILFSIALLYIHCNKFSSNLWFMCFSFVFSARTPVCSNTESATREQPWSWHSWRVKLALSYSFGSTHSGWSEQSC